jgi:hypothetical protein
METTEIKPLNYKGNIFYPYRNFNKKECFDRNRIDCKIFKTALFPVFKDTRQGILIDGYSHDDFYKEADLQGVEKVDIYYKKTGFDKRYYFPVDTGLAECFPID